jgi:hypothetical protein
MQLTRQMKLILGLLTFWSPLFTIGVCIWLYESPLLFSSGQIIETQKQLVVIMMQTAVAVVLSIATLVVLSITTVFYAVHILKNARLTEGKKVAWSLINVTVGPFVMPVYWLFHMWP